MDERDLNDEAPDIGRTYGPWVLFGVFGIGVAVGIALLAGSFASQPVGLTGNPVSAGSALKPATDRGAFRNRPSQKEKRRGNADRDAGTLPPPSSSVVPLVDSGGNYPSSGAGEPSSSGGSSVVAEGSDDSENHSKDSKYDDDSEDFEYEGDSDDSGYEDDDD